MHKSQFLAVAVLLVNISMINFNLLAQATESVMVHKVPAENGAYTVTPKLPANGKVPKGTVLTVKAKPSTGYSLDAVYYTVKGGMWGSLSYESFSPTMKITVDKEMWLGATFVKKSLVENINVTHDVVYAQPGKKPLKYDVYAPKGARNLPCIVIIHGGGWSSNNEDIMRGLARELVQGGRFVVFSIDYRWVNKLDGDEQPTSMHQLIEDVFGAIAHIQENAARYGADPSRIGVTGDSAGGHLSEAAALLCTMIGDGGFGEQAGVYEYRPTYMPKGKSVDQVREEIVNSIKAVAPSYGPSDARDFKMFITQTSEEYYDAVSPVKHVPSVKDRAVPHFIAWGDQDKTVPRNVIQSYIDVLNAAGQEVKYVEIAGANHAFFDWKPDAETRATFEKYGVKYAGEMREFFEGVFGRE